ncbi:MAG: sigma-70 family RNA polymerase sigma factor [Bacteroidetes bacterium]|nr:sigma-70 family RNA polymerase sigma factor [Bacteroidota bacterium]
MQTQLSPLFDVSISPQSHLKKFTDRELVDLYLGGNEECLGVLVERHQQQLFGFILRRTHDRDFANDVFQETFFKAIRSLKSGMYCEQDKFLPWIMRISKNMIIDHGRRAQRFKHFSTVRNQDGGREDIFNVMDIGEKINIRHFEKRQSHRRIRHLIKRLPERQKQVLIMREYFNMTFKEIKKFRRMNINTALGAMRYALINLKKMAQEEGLQFE